MAPEEPRRYPLLRGSRGRQWKLRRRRIERWIVYGGWGPSRWAAVLVLAAALAGGGWLVRRALRPDPRIELATALAAFDAGGYANAYKHAQTAVAVDPRWGLAHAVLARTLLVQGDGAGADGELARAAATGFDMRRGHQLVAEAALLEGDPDRALAEASRAAPAYRAYAGRIAARARAAKGDVAGATDMLVGVIARWPKDALAWTDMGRLRFDAGDVGAASDAAARAVALAPGEPGALTLQGEVVRSRYGLVASLPWFEAALARDPGYLPALIAEAATLGDIGRYRDMLAMTRRVLAARPGEPRALYLQAVLAARAGHRDLARGLLARTGGALDRVPGMLLLAGALDCADGRYEHAIERWRALVDRQPRNIAARRLLGAALLRSGDAHGALDVLRPVALRPDADGYTLALVARAFEALGQRDGAARFLDRPAPAGDASPVPFRGDAGVTALTEEVRAHPGEPERVVDLIRALILAGQGGEALNRAQALARAGPGVPPAWLVLGDVQAALGRPAAAAVAYARAADLRFDEPTMLRLVDALGRTGQGARAAQALALYAAQNPASVAAARLLAGVRLGARDWRGARAALDGLRASAGTRDMAVLLGFAAAAASTDDLAGARGVARAAYRLAPGNPAAVDAYGWASLGAGDRTGAGQLFAKALAIGPSGGRARWHMGQALAAADGRAAARAAVTALTDPAFPHGQPVAKRLPTR